MHCFVSYFTDGRRVAGGWKNGRSRRQCAHIEWVGKRKREPLRRRNSRYDGEFLFFYFLHQGTKAVPVTFSEKEKVTQKAKIICAVLLHVYCCTDAAKMYAKIESGNPKW